MSGLPPPTGRNTPAPEPRSGITSVGPQPNPVPAGSTSVVGASSGADIGMLQADSAAGVLQAMGAHLDAITSIIMKNSRAPVGQTLFVVDNSLIGNGQSYKLPDEFAVSFTVENFSASYITLVEGSVPGRAITVVPPYTYKVGLLPRNVQVVSLTTSQPAPVSPTYQGTVNLFLTAAVLTPTIGPLLGSAIVTDITTANATACPGSDGGNANFVVGVVNNSLSAQTCTFQVFDNIAAATGRVLCSIGALGIGQIITFPEPIMCLQGAVVKASAAPVATSVQFLTT